MEAILIFLFIILYFAPTCLGYQKANAASIFMLNLFLGWTLIGWVIALVWAVSKDSKQTVQVIHNVKQPTSRHDDLLKLADLKEKGVLSEEEFNKEKNRILNS